MTKSPRESSLQTPQGRRDIAAPAPAGKTPVVAPPRPDHNQARTTPGPRTSRLHPMPRHRLVTSSAMILSVLAAPSLQAATPAEVESAIARGKQFLYTLQKPEGRWEPDPKRVGNNHHDHPKMQGSAWGG